MSHVPPAYEFQRSANKAPSSVAESSLDYSEPVDVDADTLDEDSYVESYVAGSSIMTASPGIYPDASRTVREMHLALLYLLSNPDEFQRAIYEQPPRGATTLAEWNEEYDAEGSVNTAGDTVTLAQSTPLPFIVFADDAEVVLPQAHTASQLFGVERIEGIELEAAAGVPAISQLFLRWLALMPGGDHLNIIDPPGLTVMRIAGGRYRVTAAHRVVWTWRNDFIQIEENESRLEVDDLVHMTIVDVFETDNNGRLLSYCPTFDNRDIRKTNAAAETLRKSSSKIMSQLSVIVSSQAATRLNRGVNYAAKLGLEAAKSTFDSVKHSIDERMGTPLRQQSPHKSEHLNAANFEDALNDGLPRSEHNSPSTDEIQK